MTTPGGAGVLTCEGTVDGVKLLEAPAVAPPVAPAGHPGKGQVGAGGWYTDTNGIWQWYNAADHQVSQN